MGSPPYFSAEQYYPLPLFLRGEPKEISPWTRVYLCGLVLMQLTIEAVRDFPLMQAKVAVPQCSTATNALDCLNK